MVINSNRIAFFILLICIYFFNKAGCTIIDSRPKATGVHKTLIDPTAVPFQETYPSDTESPIITKIDGRDTLIIPKASYRIAGRVVSKRRYYMDWTAKLSPVDLALAWGPLASKQYDKFLSYSHSDRFYHYEYSSDFPLDSTVIERHSANEHLIPANPLIDKVLKSIKEGEIIELEGFLVNIEGYDGQHETMNMISSLTREDTGAGACEIIYVTQVKIKNEFWK